MGKQNRQRRAGKKRRRQGAGRRAGPPPGSRQSGGTGPAPPPPSPDELLAAAVWSWQSDGAAHGRFVEALADRGQAAVTAVNRRVDDALGDTWEHGWTPADVVHVVHRRLSASHADCAAGLVVADGECRARRGEQLHPRWEEQLAVLAPRAGAGPGAGAGWVRLAVGVLCLLARLPEVPVVVPAPGAAADVAARTARLDGRVLARVRGLLAKAESTGFEHEAEALTAKAQELIARHAIDEALLVTADDVGEPSVRRLPIEDPYADAKASLASEVAGANRCRCVHSPDLGWVTLFGYDQDLDAVELLAASLLAQATGMMVRHGPQRDTAGRSTTRSFRRSFLLGFAHRIGQRLREATDGQMADTTAAEQGKLLPVLAARDDRLRAAEREAFPHLGRRTSSVSNGTGWVAGQAAADIANLDVTAGAVRDADAAGGPPLAGPTGVP